MTNTAFGSTLQPAPDSMVTQRIRVLLCDDSLVARCVLERLLADHPAIEIVAKAANGLEALHVVRAGGVDVVVLDVEMPVMDGLTALPRLRAADPTIRVLMSSSFTTQGAAIALQALRLGAADFIAKPAAVAGSAADGVFRNELLAKILGLGRQSHAKRTPRNTGPAVRLRPGPQQRPAILAIGSSTGGPAALLALFQALGNRISVPILLTQHMPPLFTAQLAGQISRLGGPSCAEAVHEEPLRPGHVHLAPGNRHMTVANSPSGPVIALTSDPPENFCRPAVDPMLRSVGRAYPGRVLVLMLTGMGQDGLAGSEQIVAGGGSVIAQDEASSVVWGMPGAVARAGLCQAVLPLDAVAPLLLQLVGTRVA